MWLLQNFENWVQIVTFHQNLLNQEFGWLWKRWGRRVFVKSRAFNVKKNEMIIYYIMSRCLVMFLRGGKVNDVEYWWDIVEKLKVNKWSLSKWLTKEKAPINWHFTCQLTRIHENFKEKYFRTIQITSWLFERYERESEWLGCKRQCKKNWKKHHIQTNPNSYLGTW